MKIYATIALAVILVLTAAASLVEPARAQEALTVDEARQLFQRLGCTSCHNGQTARTFEEAVLFIDGWRGKYGSLDEAVAAEVEYFGGQRFESYDAMFNVMASNVGKTLDDPDVRSLYEFFKAVYEGRVDLGGLTPPPQETGGQQGAVEAGPSSNVFYATVILGVVAAIVLLVAFARAWR